MRSKLIIAFFAVVLGGAAGYFVGSAVQGQPQEYTADSAAVLKDGASAMLRSSETLMSAASMMQQSGKEHDDEELVLQGEEAGRAAELMLGKGRELMERADDMMEAANK